MNNRNNLKILSGYKGMLEYAKAAQKNEQQKLEELWRNYVVDPYWEQWAEGQYNEGLAESVIEKPIKAVDQLRHMAELLEISGVEEQIERVYDEICAILPPPEPDKTIMIYACPGLGKDVGGVVGTCIGDNILIQINPTVEGWKSIVPWVLAHEYHHTVWGYNFFYLKGSTRYELIDCLLNEGQADSFGKLLCPELEAPWLCTLTKAAEAECWEKMRKHLESSDKMLSRSFLMGDEAAPFCGYVIGYHIIQAYLNTHEEKSVIDLMDIDCRLLLADSGYEEGLGK